MKRGNTALKRGVGLASAFALAIAGAVVAAPAASAAPSGTDSIRTTPLADAAWVGPDGTVTSSPAAVGTTYAVTSPTDPADHATGTASLFKVGGTYQNAGGLQIAIPATGVPWTAGNQLKVTLGGGGTTSAGDPVVTFAKVPNNATVSQRGIAASDLDTRAGYSGTHATQGTAIGTAPTTAIKAPTAKLNPADHSELDITLPDPNGASATGVFLLSLDGIQISVAQGTSLADQVVTATVSSADVTVAGTTTLGYISPYVLSTSGDTTTTNGVVSVPSVLLSEALKNVFADGVADTTFTLQVAGTNVDSTHPIAFAEAAANSLKGASTTSGATVENSAIAAGDDTVDFKVTAGSDTKLETISLSGLKVVNSKPGTDITLSIVSDLNVADNGGSTGFAFAPDQSAGASVTLTASEKLPRIAGSNRYATAADVADLGNWDGDAVVLANGLDAKNGADALSASFLAGVKGAPILLADSSNTLPEATTDALKKLFKDSGAEVTIYVMGKTDSVSQAARDAALAAVKSTLNPVGTAAVVEVAGNDRYETSTASLSKAGASAVATANLGKGNLRTAFLASGTVNADALAAAGISAGARIPVLLTTNGDALPNSVASAIKDQHIDQIIILGATDRVSQKVEDALTADGVNVVRVAGANRFETAVDLSTLARANPTDGLGFNAGGTAYLANGLTGWVDALSVGPLAGQAGGAVLTVDGSASLPTSTATYLKNKDTTLTSVQALGSTDRITDSAVTEAAKAVVK